MRMTGKIMFLLCMLGVLPATEGSLSLLQLRASVVDGPNDAAPPKRVAVIGAGTSGLSATYFLKKKRGTRFNVTLLEKHSRVGGVVTSTKWGTQADWNQGFVDSGMVVSTRFGYPNYFNFLDEEGIQTEKRPMKVRLPDNANPSTRLQRIPSVDHSDTEFNDFYKKLLLFQGSFEEFMTANVNTTNSATQWFLDANKNMGHAYFTFMTLDLGAQTSHVAASLAFLNASGDPHYEAPVGGYWRYAKKAASYADRLVTGAEVTKIVPGTASEPVRLSWTEDGETKTEFFDHVIFTGTPSQLLELQPESDLPVKDEYEVIIDVHKTFHGATDTFYEFAAATETLPGAINVYPNGEKPPFVTFFSKDCDEACRRLYVPQSDLINEYPHQQWTQGSTASRAQIASFLRSAADKKDGMHYSGVWTGDGRFAESAWVAGMRAAMEISGENPRTYKFPSTCMRRSFIRYALWYVDDDLKPDANIAIVPPSCFRESGETPSFFASFEAYEDFYKTYSDGNF